jgi:hypothetical protein
MPCSTQNSTQLLHDPSIPFLVSLISSKRDKDMHPSWAWWHSALGWQRQEDEKFETSLSYIAVSSRPT